MDADSTAVLVRDVRQTFFSLLGIPSPSLQEGALARYCVARLRELGMTVEVDRAGEEIGADTGNLIAWLPGDTTLPTILLCAHMDTVPSAVEVRPRVDEGGIVHTDKTAVLGADDKAGVAAILAALRQIRRLRPTHGPIQVLLTIAEERGMEGIRRLQPQRLAADFGLCLDSDGPVGTFVVTGMGCVSFRIEYGFRASPADVRQTSAVRTLRQVLVELRRSPAFADVQWEIAQFMGVERDHGLGVQAVGRIRSWSNRQLQAAVRAMRTAFQSLAMRTDSYFILETDVSFPAYDIPAHSMVRERIEQSMRRCGLTPVPMRVTDGSDANWLCGEFGLPVVNLGMGYEHAHSVRERIAISDICDVTRVVLDFVANPPRNPLEGGAWHGQP
ncbi:M20/M25/M40 family metallo-hydrolase [Alicyclobacillus acidiphilus]|uniref:M20/M25/M40 family metallo-hydrolase n=1 Tax=Alicyclobacillus acidiphilus TaxID=182455 RepID=UPI0008313C53|nr:M20/M25/M40 family metallo-hydrolase [Alicyclobacillus acidiphilus]